MNGSLMHFITAIKAKSMYFLLNLVHGCVLFVPNKHKRGSLGINMFKDKVRISIRESQINVNKSQDQNILVGGALLLFAAPA